MNCYKNENLNNVEAKLSKTFGVGAGLNMMDLYPKFKFVPTNLIDWKKPKVGMVIKRFFYIPILLSVLWCLYCVWAYNVYNQDGYNTGDGYETYTTNRYFYGMFNGRSCCYNIEGSYYSDCDVEYGMYVANPVAWTAKESLRSYRENVSFVFLGTLATGIVLFVIMHFLVCGYPKRPKDTKPLREVADYCQKYSYWGIFRKRKTPKFVFFVKDGKFGILDVAHYAVFLQAKYDFLSWREKNKYLNAVIAGRHCIIDIFGRELK